MKLKQFGSPGERPSRPIRSDTDLHYMYVYVLHFINSFPDDRNMPFPPDAACSILLRELSVCDLHPLQN